MQSERNDINPFLSSYSRHGVCQVKCVSFFIGGHKTSYLLWCLNQLRKALHDTEPFLIDCSLTMALPLLTSPLYLSVLPDNPCLLLFLLLSALSV